MSLKKICKEQPENFEFNIENLNIAKKLIDRSKQAGFHVLVGASMPNVLIETGFLSNKYDANLLVKSKYRKKIALAIFEALVNFKNKYENPIIGN